MEINPIADYKGPVSGKFGLPRQAGLAPSVEGKIIFRPGYRQREALRGLDGFEYCWLIWGFSMSETKWSPTVRPPRLGGNERVGVFASRSPFRPNPLGLSCVRIASVGDGEILVLGADLADGTPIYDIKPYIPFTDAHEGAHAGFSDTREWRRLKVEFEPGCGISDCDRKTLKELLAEDPRPKYQYDPDRVYGLIYRGLNIRFRVEGDVLRVISAS